MLPADARSAILSDPPKVHEEWFSDIVNTAPAKHGLSHRIAAGLNIDGEEERLVIVRKSDWAALEAENARLRTAVEHLEADAKRLDWLEKFLRDDSNGSVDGWWKGDSATSPCIFAISGTINDAGTTRGEGESLREAIDKSAAHPVPQEERDNG